jgi:hypothetical protein
MAMSFASRFCADAIVGGGGGFAFSSLNRLPRDWCPAAEGRYT